MCLRVIIPQINFLQGGKTTNLDLITSMVEAHYDENCTNLFVFPELSIIGYNAKDLIFYLDEKTSEGTIAELKDFLEDYEKAYVGIGFPERDKYVEGIVYNSYAIIGKKFLHIWRKMHLPTFTVFEEGRYFAKARTISMPVRISDFNVGVTICYDAFYPELVRIQVLNGAEVLLVPSASPMQSMKLWDPILRSRAIENTIYVVFSNHIGYKDGLLFFGKSRIISPLGEVLKIAKFADSDLIEMKLNRENLVHARKVRPVLRDIDKDLLNLYIDYADRQTF